MKKSITVTFALLITINLFAQNSLTNTIPEFSMNAGAWEDRNLSSYLSGKFKACINAEVDIDNLLSGLNEMYSSDVIKTNEQQDHDLHGRLKFIEAQEMAFTNATLEEIFGTIVENMPGHIWRYDCENGIIYIQPATNAVSMTRVGSVSFTNESAINVENILTKYNLIVLPRFISNKRTGNMREFSRDKISIELEDAYLYEILDAVVGQIPDAMGWTIMRKRIYFYGINEDKQ